jgi:hypothetical protein
MSDTLISTQSYNWSDFLSKNEIENIQDQLQHEHRNAFLLGKDLVDPAPQKHFILS